MKYLLTLALLLPFTALASTLGTSLSLNGSSQYVTANDSTSLSVTTTRTDEGWIYINSNPSSGNGYALTGQWNDVSSQRSISIAYDNVGGTLQFILRTSPDGSTVDSASFNYTFTTGWHFVRFIYTSGGSPTMAVYVDDLTTPITTQTGMASSLKDSTATYNIAHNPVVDSGYLDGGISLWRVWSGSHTTDDKCTVYGTATTNMKAEWTLDSVLTDDSGNSNTLTAFGSPTYTTNVPTCLQATAINSIAGLVRALWIK